MIMTSALDQHSLLIIYGATSLKQQSALRNVALIGNIILILSQPVFLLNAAGLEEKQQLPIL